MHGGGGCFKKEKLLSEKKSMCEGLKFYCTVCGAQCPLTKQRLCYSAADAVDPEPL